MYSSGIEPWRVAVQEGGRRLVGEHDGVEALAEAARPHLAVVELPVRDAHLLLEDEPRPALVHRRDPGLVKAHPRKPEPERAGLRPDGPRQHAQLARQRRDEAPRRGGNEQRPGRERAAGVGERLQGPAHLHAPLQQARQGDEVSARVAKGEPRAVALDAAGDDPRLLDGLEDGLEGRGDRVHLDAEEQRQRVGGHVVRSLGLIARVLPQVRIALPLEERLREAARRLLHPDDVRSRLVAAAPRLERRPCPVHLHLAQPQHLEEPGDGRGVALPRRRHEGERLGPRARPAIHLERRPQPVLPVRRGVLEDGERSLELRLDDVGEPPRRHPARARESWRRRCGGRSRSHDAPAPPASPRSASRGARRPSRRGGGPRRACAGRRGPGSTRRRSRR